MKTFSYGSGELPLGNKTYVMGIVNITPDSFSDGGKYYSPEAALTHSLELLSDGADILDLGACSTRPFSVPVDAGEEQRRLLPVIRELKKQTSVPVSVDTFYSDTAEKALEAGADIINDTGGNYDERMIDVVREYGAGYIVMHGGVRLAPSEKVCCYPNGIVHEVKQFFDNMYEKLLDSGIRQEKICFDPGFGFMKNTQQNLSLLRELEKIKKKNGALLVGLSGKRFVGELSGETNAADRFGFARFERHQKENADDCRERRKCGGLEKIEPRGCGSVDVEQADDLTGHRRTDVRAEDDADGLPERQDARTDKAGGQHNRRRGALDYRRDRKAEEKARQRAVCHFFHCALERVGGASFQPVAHEAHAVEEQRQAAEKRNNVKNRHMSITPILCCKTKAAM